MPDPLPAASTDSTLRTPRSWQGVWKDRWAWGTTLVALALRLAFLVAWDSPGRAAAEESTWAWGHEPLCIAAAWVRGEGLADPWGHGTGTTGWLTPLYPWLLTLVLHTSDQVTHQAWLLYTLQSLASAATCLVLCRFGLALDRPRAGRLAAAAWALHPAALWHATTQVWDTTFVALGLLLLLERALATARRATPAAAACLGAGHGLLLLVNPASVSLVPCIAALLAWPPPAARPRWLAAASYVLLLAATCLPWSLRNHHELGTLGLRSNLGVELRVGNNDDATGRPTMHMHPSDSPEELARYRDMGEVAYANWSKEQALTWMRENPGRFAALTAKRTQLFWVGTPPWSDARTTTEGDRASQDPKAWVKWLVHGAVGVLALVGAIGAFRCGRAGLVLVATLVLFPGPYYLTHVSERYRMQVEPVLVLVGALPLTVRRRD